MGYNSCLDDPDLWISLIKWSSDGFEHYEYVLLYVNDVLAISDDPTEVLQNIDKYFGLNPGSLAEPSIYLSAKLKLMKMENWLVAWSLSVSKYTQETMKNMEQYFKDNIWYQLNIPKMAVNTFLCGY